MGFVLWGASVFILAGDRTIGIPADSAFQYLAISIFAAFIIGVLGVFPVAKKS